MNSLLPAGMKVTDAYFIISAIVAIITIYWMAKSYVYHNKFAVRVKALQDRRSQLRAELMAPRRRSRSKKSSGLINIEVIRSIVGKLNLLQKSQVGKINHLLVNAGYRSKDAIFIFAFFQLICPIIALVVAMGMTHFDISHPFAVKWKPLAVVFTAYMGFKMPGVMVINARTKRYYLIQKSLSDTLDLMMICAEAGLSLAAALDRVARELGGTYPEMAEELSLTSVEIGFLPDRKRALVNLAERVDMPEIRGITGVLIQTEKYGTPIAQALRVLAAEFREQRMLRAEQKAARLPAIMTIPMIVFILPTLFIVVLAPALIKLSDTLK